MPYESDMFQDLNHFLRFRRKSDPIVAASARCRKRASPTRYTSQKRTAQSVCWEINQTVVLLESACIFGDLAGEERVIAS